MRFVLLLALLLSAPSYSAVVAVESAALANTAVRVNAKFGGFIGDAIDLPAGEHTLSFDGPHGYEFSIRVVVSDTVSVTSATGSRFDDCIANRVSRYVLQPWPTPRVTGNDRRYALTIDAPVFTDRGDQGECQSESSMLMLQRLGRAQLAVASTPAESDILLNGAKIGTTNSDIVVPYTNGDRQSIQLVLRKTGFANCLRTVAIPAAGGDISAAIECTLQPSP